MKICLNKIIVANTIRGMFLVAAVLLTSNSVWAANVIWSGADLISNTNWSDGVNWAGTPPASSDAVFFVDAGGAASAGIVDNIVDTSTTIASLKYGNTNNFHTTQINLGQTLTVTGGLTVGTETTNADTQIVTATVVGAGTLSITGGTNIVRQCAAASGTTHNATLDMSGLSNFTANVSAMLIGVQRTAGTGGSRASGSVLLAMTNQITAGYILMNFNAGSPPLETVNPSLYNSLYFGQTNVIFANIITNGADKGQYATLMTFRSGLTSPMAYIRAADGVSRVTTWMSGDNSHQTTSANTANGTQDFSGGTVDALVTTMALGKGGSAPTTAGAGGGTGTLIVGNGTFDVNTLQVGFQTANNSTAPGKGFVTVGAGSGVSQGIVKVNTLMEVGKVTGGTGANNSFGVITVTNGGTLQAKSIVFGTAVQTNVFTINGGNLVVNDTAATVVGSSAIPLATLNMTNSSLRLSLNGSTATTPKIYVGTLNIPNTGGPTTSINIDTLANVTTTTNFSIINSATRNGDPTTFVAGSLPSGYSATVINTGTEIQLQVSPGAGAFTSKPTVLSFSLSGGTNVVMSGTNGQAGDAYYLLTSTNVALPLAQWTVAATNIVGSVGANGSFTFTGTNVIVPSDKQQFYILSSTNSNHP